MFKIFKHKVKIMFLWRTCLWSTKFNMLAGILPNAINGSLSTKENSRVDLGVYCKAGTGY